MIEVDEGEAEEEEEDEEEEDDDLEVGVLAGGLAQSDWVVANDNASIAGNSDSHIRA